MDSRAVANLTEMTEAENNITLLKQQLADANKDLSNWKIEIEVEVVPFNDTYQLDVRSAVGGKVYNRRFSQIDITYFVDDKQSFMHDLAQRTLLQMLTDEMKSELNDKVSKAMDNILRLSQSKGFSK